MDSLQVLLALQVYNMACLSYEQKCDEDIAVGHPISSGRPPVDIVSVSKCLCRIDYILS